MNPRVHTFFCGIRARIVLAAIGVFVGLLVFPMFAWEWHDWNAAIWGLISAIVASIVVYIHVRYCRGTLSNASRASFTTTMLVGCFVQLAGVCSFTTYIALGAVLQQDIMMKGENYYLASVWSFMTFKWGFALFYWTRRYRTEFYGSNGLLSTKAKQQQYVVTVADPASVVTVHG